MAAHAFYDRASDQRGPAGPNDYNDHAGSVLLEVGGRVIGAIGVGGADSHEIDDACAHAAVAGLQSKLR